MTFTEVMNTTVAPPPSLWSVVCDPPHTVTGCYWSDDTLIIDWGGRTVTIETVTYNGPHPNLADIDGNQVQAFVDMDAGDVCVF
jgi:hypothetical protein